MVGSFTPCCHHMTELIVDIQCKSIVQISPNSRVTNITESTVDGIWISTPYRTFEEAWPILNKHKHT